MKFKEWLQFNELNKGLVRHFRQSQPGLPSYVAKQVLQNRVAPLWKNTLAATMPTIGPPEAKHPKLQALLARQETMPYTPPPKTNPDRPTYNNPNDIYGDQAVGAIADSKNWKQGIVQVSPLDFTRETVQMFLRHEFGSSPSLSRHVRNHDERMKVQSDLAGQRGQGENEPIIMIQRDGKYEMQEGWHRLYSYLLQYSATPEERAKIEGGHIEEVDLSKWRPIRIKAWVGS